MITIKYLNPSKSLFSPVAHKEANEAAQIVAQFLPKVATRCHLHHNGNNVFLITTPLVTNKVYRVVKYQGKWTVAILGEESPPVLCEIANGKVNICSVKAQQLEWQFEPDSRALGFDQALQKTA